MRVSIEDNSIPNSALLDGVVSGTSSSGGGSTIDSSIITLVAFTDIEKGKFITILQGDGRGIHSHNIDGQPAIGVSIESAIEGASFRVRTFGFADMDLSEISDPVNSEIYCGFNGNPISFSYISDGQTALQLMGYKISDNQIFINIGKRVLML